MYKVVEINHSPTPPITTIQPPKAKKKAKKKAGKAKLSKEKLLEIVIILERQIRYLPKAQERYRRISNKHKVDLATWVESQKDLPKDDHGRQLCLYIERCKKAPGKLEFYKKILAKYEESNSNEASKGDKSSNSDDNSSGDSDSDKNKD